MRRLLLILALSITACAQSGPPVRGRVDLPALLAMPKFEPDALYTGVDTLEDKQPLTRIVDDAIREIIAMPEPRDAEKVRHRLSTVVEQAGGSATEDRERAYMYAIMTWRAAGFTTESKLLPVPDDEALQEP